LDNLDVSKRRGGLGEAGPRWSNLGINIIFYYLYKFSNSFLFTWTITGFYLNKLQIKKKKLSKIL